MPMFFHMYKDSDQVRVPQCRVLCVLFRSSSLLVPIGTGEHGGGLPRDACQLLLAASAPCKDLGASPSNTRRKRHVAYPRCCSAPHPVRTPAQIYYIC